MDGHMPNAPRPIPMAPKNSDIRAIWDGIRYAGSDAFTDQKTCPSQLVRRIRNRIPDRSRLSNQLAFYLHEHFLTIHPNRQLLTIRRHRVEVERALWLWFSRVTMSGNSGGFGVRVEM